MKSSGKGQKWLYNFLASKGLAISIWIVLGIILSVTTFSEGNNSVIWNIVGVLLSLMLINLSLCTVQRIRSLPWPVLVIHAGIILTFIGGGISSYGFVATVNIYEGGLADRAYRWDIERDISLGVDIMVKKLHEEYYPVPVKVGVLMDGVKKGLYQLRTGESFHLERYRVKVDSIDIASRSTTVSVFNGNEYIGSASTLGSDNFPAGFPYAFKLVAYADPVIKKTWVDLALLKDSEIVAEGKTEVNGPLHWNGLSFYHTATDRDESGNAFVGIQITRVPGIYVVYTGFCIISFGGIFYILRRLRGRR